MKPKNLMGYSSRFQYDKYGLCDIGAALSMGELRIILQDCRIGANVDECYLNFYKLVPNLRKAGSSRLSYVGDPIQIDPAVIDAARSEAKALGMTSEQENEFVINSVICLVDIKAEMAATFGSVPAEIDMLLGDLHAYENRQELDAHVPSAGIGVRPRRL